MRFRLHSSPFARRVSVLFMASALAVGIAGTSGPARAQEVEVEIARQPPAPRVEVVPVRPSPRHFWIPGYWGWNGTAHYWLPGRYELMRPGWGWSEAHWVEVGNRYHFYPGHWYALP